MLNPTEKDGEYARKKNGNYLLGHFAEGNELERASSVVLTVYSNDELKILRQVNVGLIKNRDGTPLQYAFQVAIEPEYYTFGNKILIAAREAEDNIPTLEEALGEYQPPTQAEPVEIDWGL